MKRAKGIRLQPKLLLGLVAMGRRPRGDPGPPRLPNCTGRGWRAIRLSRVRSGLRGGVDLIDGDRVEQYYRTGEKGRLLRGDPPLPAGRQGEAGAGNTLCGRAGDEVMYYIWDAASRGGRRLATSATPTPTTAAATIDARGLCRRRETDHPHHQQRGVLVIGVGLRRHLQQSRHTGGAGQRHLRWT